MPVEITGSKLDRIPSLKSFSLEPPTPSMLEQAERNQSKIARHLESAGDIEVRNAYRFKNIPSDIQAEAVQIIDKICEKEKIIPISKRLLALNEKVAAATERYIFSKKEKEFEKKNKVERQIDDQKTGRNQQGWCQAGSGFGTAILTMAAGFFTHMAPNTGIGTVLDGLSRLTQPGAQALSTWIESSQLPLSYEERYFLNSVQADKQTLEGLKRLPDEIRQFVLDLVRLELRAVEGISQR